MPHECNRSRLTDYRKESIVIREVLMPDIKIPKDELPALRMLSEWKEEDFRSLVGALKSSKPKLMASQFADEITEKLHGSLREQAMIILKLIFGLYSFREKADVPINEFASAIATSASRVHNFEDKKTETLNARLQELLAFDDNLGVALKAL